MKGRAFSGIALSQDAHSTPHLQLYPDPIVSSAHDQTPLPIEAPLTAHLLQLSEKAPLPAFCYPAFQYQGTVEHRIIKPSGSSVFASYRAVVYIIHSGNEE